MKKLESSSVLNAYFKEIRDIPGLSREKEEELSKIILSASKDSAEYRKALDTLVTANLRFCVTIAKEYHHDDYDLTDIIGYAHEGLIEAAHRFDYSKKVKFISYAVWWIRQNIRRRMQIDKTIKVPSNAIDKINRIYSVMFNFFPERTEPPPYNEIKSYISITEDKYYELLRSENILSLQTPLSENLVSENHRDMVKDIQRPDPAYDAEMAIVKQQILKRMDILTEREREILKDRFGLNGRVSHTLQAVGDKYHITRERVRQIENKAKDKLSKYYELKRLLGSYKHIDAQEIVV